MGVRSFLDTNVLVYTDDHDSPEKQAVALDLFERVRQEHSGVLSTQVLQEYFVAATRKLGVDAAIARRKLELFGRLDLVEISRTDILGAIDIHRLHGIGFWDALIVRAAIRANCGVLYTEDLQHCLEIDGLKVENPFKKPRNS